MFSFLTFYSRWHSGIYVTFWYIRVRTRRSVRLQQTVVTGFFITRVFLTCFVTAKICNAEQIKGRFHAFWDDLVHDAGGFKKSSFDHIFNYTEAKTYEIRVNVEPPIRHDQVDHCTNERYPTKLKPLICI